jgi:16S rRNA processing protein RimM
MDGLSVPFYFKEFEPFAGKVKVIFHNMGSEKLASELTGKRFHMQNPDTKVTDQDLPELAALISFAVHDKKIGDIGKITDFFDYPGNPCFEITWGEKQSLIPINEELIQGVSMSEKILFTNLPDGLLDI